MQPSAFDTAGIGRLLDAASPDALDLLPFSVIAMDQKGLVVAYNRHEEAASGLERRSLIGLPFFSGVGICMDTPQVAGRLAIAQEVDVTLDYTLTFRMRPTKVRLRLVRSAAFRNRYLLIERRLAVAA